MVLKSDGSVAAWGGRNGEGIVPDGVAGVVSISAGADHSVAVTGSGELKIWGLTSTGSASLASNGNFSMASAGGDFTVGVSASGPIISSHPQTQTVLPGSAVVLSVTASGASEYQWFFNGDAIDGETGTTLSLAGVSRLLHRITPGGPVGDNSMIFNVTPGTMTVSPGTFKEPRGIEVMPVDPLTGGP